MTETLGYIDRALASGVLQRPPSPQADQSFADLLRRIPVGSLMERRVQRLSVGSCSVGEGRIRLKERENPRPIIALCGIGKRVPASGMVLMESLLGCDAVPNN
ncbi:hypothetical protein [Methylobacterium sp. Leaf123]|uniref:hypothetical protein n=1 Tax=Methylobacterium sp. Leaf123 TaxID=1736264 RepID=UPI000AAD7306|nr:hypothetical protein [Methylobacterium sp. Leaf123]